MDLTLLRTNSIHAGFRTLVALLDADLREKDGDDHAFYAQYNKVDSIGEVIVALKDDQAIACGAIKQYSPQAAEIKRMFVLPQYRGKRIGAMVLDALEAWARDLGYSECILETGRKQHEAIALYRRSGYSETDNYGQYQGVENSVCMRKIL